MSTAQVAGVIHSTEEFLAALRVGDTFYWMSTRNFRPYAVEGPWTFLGTIKLGKNESLNVKCSCKGSPSGRLVKIEHFCVGDLVNEHHGVFVNYEEAFAYFREARRAYDAEYVAENRKKG